MQKVLTDSFIANLAAPSAGRIELADTRCSGLALRVTTGGIKSWSFRYRPKGGAGVSRVTLGTYPDIGLGKARKTADEMRGTVAAGGDPAHHKRAHRAGAKTFGALAARYLVEYAERHKRSHAADERNLRLHVLPKWKNRAYSSIKRGDVIELVESIVATGKGTLANRVHSLISTVFTFAIDASLMDAHPCHRLKKRGTERVGERVLSDGEIRLFWGGIVEGRTDRTGLGLRLALLTGARVGEIAGLSRSSLIDLDSPTGAALAIPRSGVKNDRDFIIPLAPLARATVLELLATIEAGDAYLFPTRSRRRRGPIRPNTLTQAMANFGAKLAKRKGAAGDPASTWTADPDDMPSPHDLRRTVETRLASLGVAKEYRDAVLNHAAGDVGSRHYNKHDYLPEKRAALTRWNDALGAILRTQLGGGDVLAFPDRRGVA